MTKLFCLFRVFTLTFLTWNVAFSLLQDCQAASLKHTLIHPKNASLDIDFSADGNYLVDAIWVTAAPAAIKKGLAPEYCRIDFLRIPSLKLGRSFFCGSEVRKLALSPDGRFLAANLISNEVLVWNLHSGAKIRSFPVPNASWGLAFSPDGSLLACGGLVKRMDGEEIVLLYNLSSGKLVRKLKDFSCGDISRIAFSPSGRLLAATTYAGEDSEGELNVWNRNSGKLLMHKVDDEGQPKIWGTLKFAPGEHTLFCGQMRVNLQQGKAIFGEMLKHRKYKSLDITNSGRVVALESWEHDGFVDLWNLIGQRRFQRIECGADSPLKAVFSPRGRYLAVARQGGGLLLQAVRHSALKK